MAAGTKYSPVGKKKYFILFLIISLLNFTQHNFNV